MGKYLSIDVAIKIPISFQKFPNRIALREYARSNSNKLIEELKNERKSMKPQQIEEFKREIGFLS